MDRDILLKQALLVAERLMNLGGANYDEDKNLDLADALRTGAVARDAGIEEWDWPQGVGLYGLYLLQEYLGDGRYLDFFEGWYQRNIRQGLPSRNVNTTAPYLTLVQLADRLPETEAYDAMCRERAEWLISGLPKTRNGGFQHVTSAIGDRNGVILNEGQLWVDTLFMAGLFLQKAGLRYGCKEWQEEALHQILVHIKYLYCKETGLFYHGFSFPRNDNFGGIHWCRGNSWFTLGLPLFLENAEAVDGGTRRFLLDTFGDHAEALRRLQAPSGLFHTVLDDPESYEEASGSAAIAAGILRGIRLGCLDSGYRPFAEGIVEGLLGCIGPDGVVDKVSAGTAMGMNREHYLGIGIRPMAYGQALTLVALVEALMLQG